MDEAERAQVRALFVAERGYWRPWTEAMLQANPAFLRHYARYAGHPARTGPLTERQVELIYVALDASASHLFESGLKTHMARALQAGATEGEVFDVLQLVALQGVACVDQAAHILCELLGPDAAPMPVPALDAATQTRMKQASATLGLALSDVARLDPAYVALVLDLCEHGRPEGGLPPGERALIQVALHACFTAFNAEALRRAMAAALAAGQPPAALLQAAQLGAHLSVHGTALGTQVHGAMAAGTGT